MYKNETFEDTSGDDLIKNQKWEWDFGIGKIKMGKWKMGKWKQCAVAVEFL